MIKIYAERTVKPESLEAYKELGLQLVKASQAEEGCISYTLNQCRENPCVFAFIEVWKDQDAINYHNATAHFTTLVPQMGALCSEKAPVKHFTEV